MTKLLEKAFSQASRLSPEEQDAIANWLLKKLENKASWDKQIARDSLPGGRLEVVLERVQTDIAEGKTKPLDEILDNS